jgi:hypothetical protein
MPVPAEKQRVIDALKGQASAEELLDQLFEAFEPAELNTIFHNIITVVEEGQPSNNTFAQRLQTKQYSQKERVEFEFISLCKFFEHRRTLLESTITPPQVGKLLNTTRQTPLDRREAGTMLAVQDNGAWRYPLWQFDPEGPNGVVDGLPDVLRTLKISDFSKINWLTRENQVLQSTPIEALKQGRKAEVLREALAVDVT